MELEILENNETKPRTFTSFGKILVYGTGGLAIGVSIICIPFVSPALRKFCLPFVPATPAQISGVTKALAGRTGKLLDVGSGDGRIVFSAAKAGFKAVGVELNPWLVLYSKVNSIFSPYRNEVSFFRRDLWTLNLTSYDNIVIFGVEQMMKDFEEKLLREMNNGSVVVACRFPLPNLKPVETIGSGFDTVWKYVINR